MKKAEIFGVDINFLSHQSALETISGVMIDKSSKKIRIATINNEISNLALEENSYRDVLNCFEMKVADSVGVKWAIKTIYNIDAERVQGVRLAYDICRIGESSGRSIFLLGGDSEIGTIAAANLKKIFPELKIAGVIDGIKIDAKKNIDIIEKINLSKASVVFVCLGAPKQEMWINNNYNFIHSRIFIGLGGTLDFISGKITRAPGVVQKVGLEWLFRFCVQPSRYKRIFSAIVVFPARVLRELIFTNKSTKH